MPWANSFELGTRFILRGHPAGAMLSGVDGGGGVVSESALGRDCKDSQTFRIKYLSGPVNNPSFDTLHEVKCTDLVRVGEDAQFTVDGETLIIDYVDIAPSDFLILDSQNIYIQTDNNSNISSPGFNTNLFPGFSAIRSVLSTKSNGFATWRTPITIFGDNDDAGVRIDNNLFIGQVDMLDDDAFEVFNPRPLCYVVHPFFGNQVVDCGSFSSGQETMFDTNGALECFNIPFGVDQITIDAYAGGGGGGGGSFGVELFASLFPNNSYPFGGGGGGGGGSAGESATNISFEIPANALNPRICANVGSGGVGGFAGELRAHVNQNANGNPLQVGDTTATFATNGFAGGDTIVTYEDDSGNTAMLVTLEGGSGGDGSMFSEGGGPDGYLSANSGSPSGPMFAGKGGQGALGAGLWWHNGGTGRTKYTFSPPFEDFNLNDAVSMYVGFSSAVPAGASMGGPGGIGENPHAFDITAGVPISGECHQAAGGGWEGDWSGDAGCSPDPETSPGAGGGGGGGARGYWHITSPGWLTGYDYTYRIQAGLGGNGASGRVDIVW
jgi:hypothetical protein